METKYVVVVNGVVYGVGNTPETAIEVADIPSIESVEERSVTMSEYPRSEPPKEGVAYICECTPELAAAIENKDGILPLAWDERTCRMGVESKMSV